jgi:hypothetical protein
MRLVAGVDTPTPACKLAAELALLENGQAGARILHHYVAGGEIVASFSLNFLSEVVDGLLAAAFENYFLAMEIVGDSLLVLVAIGHGYFLLIMTCPDGYGAPA